MIKSILFSDEGGEQQLELNKLESVDMSAIDFSKYSTVFENGHYQITFLTDEIVQNNISTIEAYVNGNKIGDINWKKYNSSLTKGDVKYIPPINNQPFLLYYDLVRISFLVTYTDGSSDEYVTDFLLCISKNKDDTNNIQKIIEELINFDNSEIEKWIFSISEQESSYSFYEGKWNKHAFRSLNSYIQLLEQITSGYINNYSYLKMQSKHTIKQETKLVSYNKVKKISRNNFNWIIQNTNQLSTTFHKSGIQFEGKNYLPYQIIIDANQKSVDVYENRVIINFLHTVILNAQQIYQEFNKNVIKEERIISKIHNGNWPNEYYAPIITIKSLQISYCKNSLKKLTNSIDKLIIIYNQYKAIFNFSVSKLTTLPKKTSTFCEVKAYSQLFELIIKWFDYGEYCLEKEQLILRIKTLDKLFEYYCLFNILKLLSINGFHLSDIPRPAFKYFYTTANNYYQNEQDIANTYKLTRDNTTVTLYYQPVISASQFENNLTLYRSRIKNSDLDYYVPDFILKFSTNDTNYYAIFDAKFSTRDTIITYSLQEIIRKYSCEISVANKNDKLKMVWILQGRTKKNEYPLYKYHNSKMANIYLPEISYGISSINCILNNHPLWNEIKKYISL